MMRVGYCGRDEKFLISFFAGGNLGNGFINPIQQMQEFFVFKEEGILTQVT